MGRRLTLHGLSDTRHGAALGQDVSFGAAATNGLSSQAGRKHQGAIESSSAIRCPNEDGRAREVISLNPTFWEEDMWE
jgi:hypothetical protein